MREKVEQSSTKKAMLKQFLKFRDMNPLEKDHKPFFSYLAKTNLAKEHNLSSLVVADGLSFEGLRLLVYIEQQKRLEKGESFNCYVIHLNDLKTFINTITADENIPAKGNRRIQVIIGSGEAALHFATCDFQLATKERLCFLLDAANAIGMIFISEVLEKAFTDGKLTRVFWARNDGQNGGVQRDLLTCSVHAFYHACESSKLDKIFDLLKEKANPSDHFQYPNAINWMKLNPELVALGQKSWWLKIFRDHTDVNSYAVLHPGFADIKIPSLGMTFNEIIHEVENLEQELVFLAFAEFVKFQAEAVNYIDTLTTEELNTITQDQIIISPLNEKTYAHAKIELKSMQHMVIELNQILHLYQENSSDSNTDSESEEVTDAVGEWQAYSSKDWSGMNSEANQSKEKDKYIEQESLTISEIKDNIRKILANENLDLEQLKIALTEQVKLLIYEYQKEFSSKSIDLIMKLNNFLITHMSEVDNLLETKQTIKY